MTKFIKYLLLLILLVLPVQAHIFDSVAKAVPEYTLEDFNNDCALEWGEASRTFKLQGEDDEDTNNNNEVQSTDSNS